MATLVQTLLGTAYLVGWMHGVLCGLVSGLGVCVGVGSGVWNAHVGLAGCVGRVGFCDGLVVLGGLGV